MSDAPSAGEETSVIADAFTGSDVATGRFTPRFQGWALGRVPAMDHKRLVPSPPDPANWLDERVGWGLVLPENENLPQAERAGAGDAPEPIQALLAARMGKVLRYVPGEATATWTLRDYAAGQDLVSAGSPPGRGPARLPMYLLIAASPDLVPWHVQYGLSCVRHVGRLDLDAEGLANYVQAALSGWSGAAAAYDAPLVWSVDHGGGDITTLMREAVGQRLHARFTADADMGGARLLGGPAGPEATGATLAAELAQRPPAIVVTTSHGMTGPLADLAAMRANLGALVGEDHQPVRPETLLSGWQPDGAVWLAQACCSAGADTPSAYAGLFTGVLGDVLTGVAALGAMTSPLPRALLGAPRPLRAFVGHVEPTFNWTMEFPPNRQLLTSDLEAAVYDGIAAALPVGLALSIYYRPIGTMLLNHSRAVSAVNTARPGAETDAVIDSALYGKVTAYDRAATVLLGDPAVALRLPVPAG
jgi:hypothetical protein